MTRGLSHAEEENRKIHAGTKGDWKKVSKTGLTPCSQYVTME